MQRLLTGVCLLRRHIHNISPTYFPDGQVIKYYHDLGILAYVDEPLVSVDFMGNPASSLVDGGSTNVIDGNFVKVLSWYDNEAGYSARCVDLANYIGGRL